MGHKIMMAILLTLLGCAGEEKGTSASKKGEDALISYEYHESTARIYPSLYYLVDMDDQGNPRLHYSKWENEITIIKAPSDILQRIEAIARSYNLRRLSSSYRPPRWIKILDGDSWGLDLNYENGSYISSSGYESYPSGKKKKGMDEINSLLSSIIESSKEADVVGHSFHREEEE